MLPPVKTKIYADNAKVPEKNFSHLFMMICKFTEQLWQNLHLIAVLMSFSQHNMVQKLQHFCNTVQILTSVVILQLLLQNCYNTQFVWMKGWKVILCHVKCHSYKGKWRNCTSHTLSLHTETAHLPAAADALVDGALGPSNLCPTRWHQPTGYMSGLSQSSHWSYSSSQPSKWIFSRRPTTRDTVPTHTNRGSMRSAASNLMPTTNPWAGISCRQMIKRQTAVRYKQSCRTIDSHSNFSKLMAQRLN